jgi:hypothetical protein
MRKFFPGRTRGKLAREGTVGSGQWLGKPLSGFWFDGVGGDDSLHPGPTRQAGFTGRGYGVSRCQRTIAADAASRRRGCSGQRYMYSGTVGRFQ